MATTEDELWKNAFKRLVLWTVKTHGMNRADAEETVQDAVRLFLKAGGTADPANPKALLDALGSKINGIAVNRPRNKARKAVELNQDGLLLVPDQTPSQEKRVIDGQIAKRAVTALLDRVQSDGIVAAVLMEMSEGNDVPADQAAAIGCAIGEIYNGRRRLKAHTDAVRTQMETW